MKETYPLQWPDGWPRTFLGDREERKGWKKTERQAIADLELELKRFDVVSSVLTRKDPNEIRGAADPSVAAYFSRKAKSEDFSWQRVLQITNPSPTVEEIETAYRRLVSPYHPDRGGDAEVFRALTKHKEAAIAYAKRLSGATHDHVIAADKYTEARWNIFAISNTVYSFRQMERDGTSVLLDRTLQGFKVLTEGSRVEHATAS
jgi:hypothetical protein